MISGGGTGGHIYPAISIAQALKGSLTKVDILFVGARGRMEMEKVPEAGFEIVGLWISGIKRKLDLGNMLFPLKLMASLLKSVKLLKSFKPDVVVGVGGYASGPLLYAATKRKIPTLIQEQNSYAGLTNKWLASKVDKVCVAYDDMQKYFPRNKLIVTGNPVRLSIKPTATTPSRSFGYFNLNPAKKTVLMIGGSLGSRTMNESLITDLHRLVKYDIQLIWQTGSYYFEEMIKRTRGHDLSGVRILDFIPEMQYAYAVADIVISRAGALSIAELMLTGKACILIPSPNVAENHQDRNAEAMVAKDAALKIADENAQTVLIDELLSLINDGGRLKVLAQNIKRLAKPRAAFEIANEVIKLAG